MKNWFNNFGRKRRKKDKIRYTKRWTWRRVASDVDKKKIEVIVRDLSGANPGRKNYLAKYQEGRAMHCNGLSGKEKMEFQQLAIEWNNMGPPPGVRRKSVTFCL
jgi:hypothetical protein